MKGLVNIPSQKDLLSAYEKLQTGGTIPDLSEIALFSQYARFDPRLAELLAAACARSWQKILPTELNLEILKTPWPAALGVILEQARTHYQIPEKPAFKHWAAIVMHGISPAKNEHFFIGLRSFAGNLLFQDVCMSLKSYRRWGFFGKEVLKNKADLGKGTWMAPALRQKILRDLLSSKRRLTVNDYLAALGGNVSRRQAERDLAASKARKWGRTRGRVYTR